MKNYIFNGGVFNSLFCACKAVGDKVVEAWKFKTERKNEFI